MPRKETAKKETSTKEEKSIKTLIAKRGNEFSEWKAKNATQKRFFTLEDREQKLLETSYIVVLQYCPELSWEEYLNRLRTADNCNAKTKTIWKQIPIKILK